MSQNRSDAIEEQACATGPNGPAEHRRDMTLEPPQTKPGRRAIGARQFMGTFITSVMLQGFTLVQGVILARVLGAEGRGNFAAIILWPNIIANIGLFGTNLAITRASAAAGDDVGPVARAGVRLSLILSAVTLAVGLGLLPFLIPEDGGDIMRLATTFMILFVPAYILTANLSGVDQGQGHFRKLNFFRLLQSPVNVVFLVVLILLAQANLAYCVWAMLAAFWVTALGRLVMLGRQVSLVGPVASLLTLLRQGLPYAIANTLLQFTQRGDRILLLWLLTKYDLGLYAVAFSAAGILAAVPRSMGIVSLTITARERPGEGFARIAKIFRGAVVVSVGVGIIVVAAIYLLLPVIYGWDFAGARIIGIILAAGFVPAGLTSVLSLSMQGQGNPLAGVYARLAGLGVMVLAAFMLAAPLGAAGVALGFLAAQAVSLLCLLLLTVRHYHSASLSAMAPTVNDVRQVIRRLRQQTTAVLGKFGIVRCPTPQNTPTSERSSECDSGSNDQTS